MEDDILPPTPVAATFLEPDAKKNCEILWNHIHLLLILASIYSIISHQGMSLSQPSKTLAE